MSLIVPALAAALVLPSPDLCGEPFHWDAGAASVMVSPAASARLVLAPSNASGPPLEGVSLPGRLVLDARPDGLVGGDGPWAPAEPRLSFAPPGVPLSADQPEIRIRFGDDRRARVNRQPRSEFFWAAGRQGFYEAWTDSRQLGPGAVERFRRSGGLTVELWTREGGGRLRLTSSARFDWADVEALARRARDHYATCPPA